MLHNKLYFLFIFLTLTYLNVVANIVSYDDNNKKIIFDLSLLQSKDLFCEEWIPSNRSITVDDLISKYSEHELGYYEIVRSNLHMNKHPGGVKSKMKFCNKINLYKKGTSRTGTEITSTFVFRKRNNSEIYAILALGDDGNNASDHLSYLGFARKKGEPEYLLTQSAGIINNLINSIEKFNHKKTHTTVSGVVQYGFAIQASKVWETLAENFGFELYEKYDDYKLYKKYFDIHKSKYITKS